MIVKEILNDYKADLPVTFLNYEVVSDMPEWKFYSRFPINGLIAMGWLSDDNILGINSDGIFIYDMNSKEVVFEDYETPINKCFSDDNLTFFLSHKEELVNIFGLRGGGGNLLTKEKKWRIELVHLSWNIRIPALLNYKSGETYFLQLFQNFYEGYKYLGFSKTEKYFAIMGDGGVDIYFKKD